LVNNREVFLFSANFAHFSTFQKFILTVVVGVFGDVSVFSLFQFE